MRILDLFSGAGGAAMGLHQAFPEVEITGVDIRPQPRYPFRHVVADAMTYPLDGFDLIWASPPCQRWTAYNRRPVHVRERPDLIGPTRARLIARGAPYVIENVRGAPLRAGVRLCGTSFGLDVQRHRYFECSFPVLAPGCQHGGPARYAQATNRRNKRRTVEVGVWRIPLSVQRAAMGIEWMELEELSEAIPPAYSAYLARFVPLGRRAVA